MSEHLSHPTPEHKAEQQRIYYISEKGQLWSPMVEVGTITNTNGEVTKYILGDLTDLEKTREVPADWFDAYKDELEVKDGESWAATADKPTLETGVMPEADGVTPEQAEHAEVPQEVREDIGRGALEAAGVSAPVERASGSQEKALVDQLAQLREGLSDNDQIALHKYATALYGYEETAARQRMSLELQADKQRLLSARRIYKELSDIRESNR